MNKDIKLAYFAGALDGDGSFSLIKGTPNKDRSPLYYPMIQLANAKKELIELFKNEFGGSVNLRKAYMAKDGHERKPSYQWKQEKSAKCLPLLESIIPYLIIKRKRAEFLRDYIIDNPFIRGSNRLDADTLMNREKSYLKMRSFNDNPDTSGLLLSKAKRVDSDSDLFWSYVAGLMDTDGSFSLKKENRTSRNFKSPVYMPVILLSMVDCRAIYHIMNNFIGGNMIIIKAKTTTNGFCYRFSITSKKAALSFLKKCIPFLHLKKQIAETLLESCEAFVRMNGKSGVSPEQNLIRDKYYSAIKKLNYGVSKSSLMDLKPLTDNSEGNKAEGNDATVNAVSEKTTKVDAVL